MAQQPGNKNTESKLTASDARLIWKRGHIKRERCMSIWRDYKGIVSYASIYRILKNVSWRQATKNLREKYNV
jgi:hypothetical protein